MFSMTIAVIGELKIMAINFSTLDASGLLKKFDSAIKQIEPKGKITTWEIHSDGKHYTHKAPEWKSKAFLRAVVESNQLKFNIVAPKNGAISSLVYAYYHGHLIETFLTHFESSFVNATASSYPEKGDIIS